MTLDEQLTEINTVLKKYEAELLVDAHRSKGYFLSYHVLFNEWELTIFNTNYDLRGKIIHDLEDLEFSFKSGTLYDPEQPDRQKISIQKMPNGLRMEQVITELAKTESTNSLFIDFCELVKNGFSTPTLNKLGRKRLFEIDNWIYQKLWNLENNGKVIHPFVHGDLHMLSHLIECVPIPDNAVFVPKITTSTGEHFP